MERKIVYTSKYKPDCTSIKNQLRERNFAATVVKCGSSYGVTVRSSEYEQAHNVIWGTDAILDAWQG